MSEIDYGPLAGLIGTWEGDKGTDVAPEDDGPETNQYTERMIFTGADDVDNAETQELVGVHYKLEAHRIRDGKHIHHQTGYWIWDAADDVIMHCFAIPRAVCVVAGGCYRKEDDGSITFEVMAGEGSPDWQIVQSPFMRDHALTTSFRQSLSVGPDLLSYQQTTLVDIYAFQNFEHTDENLLRRA